MRTRSRVIKCCFCWQCPQSLKLLFGVCIFGGITGRCSAVLLPEAFRSVTNPTCHELCGGLCFGPNSDQCCDSECAGGCDGPGPSNCWACLNFENDGRCVKNCPPYQIYHPERHQWLPNPNKKYAYGTKCLDTCPSHMYGDMGACVSTCGEGRTNVNGACELCDEQCPRTCPGWVEGSSHFMRYVHSGNIANYINCTVIEGGLVFINNTFKGDRWLNTGPMSVDMLRAFEHVQVVRDYITVNAYWEGFTSLSFFRNLRTIKGQHTDGRAKTSLAVIKTSLEELGLVSLRSIENGNVRITGNQNLCMADTITWSIIAKSISQDRWIERNKPDDACEELGAVCSPVCWMGGCWGAGDDQCLVCPNYRRSDTRQCLATCDDVPLFYADRVTRECRPCHRECLSACTGEGSDLCDACANAQDGPYCVAECPPSKYRDSTGICQPCHSNNLPGCLEAA